eukprot:TRINITY_DN312_c5_g1_i1.p1 TRINITY_DN312_c5_g1~~TRINITY_DN312_c5_g1_i1.p1  ORF type:complete len:224 (+),score=66.39 TRINITY_DN312_c5_g1_i1:131-802(+)
MVSSSLCLPVFVLFHLFSLSLIHAQSPILDPYLFGSWRDTSQSTNFFTFNSDGTFSGLVENFVMRGSYSVDQTQTPWWLDLRVNNEHTFTVPGVYSHPSASSSSSFSSSSSSSSVTGTSASTKELRLAFPSNQVSIIAGSVQRPSSLVNATLFLPTTLVQSLPPQSTTAFGSGVFHPSSSSGTPPPVDCDDCFSRCKTTCGLADVSRAKCEKKCQKLMCKYYC